MNPCKNRIRVGCRANRWNPVLNWRKMGWSGAAVATLLHMVVFRVLAGVFSPHTGGRSVVECWRRLEAGEQRVSWVSGRRWPWGDLVQQPTVNSLRLDDSWSTKPCSHGKTLHFALFRAVLFHKQDIRGQISEVLLNQRWRRYGALRICFYPHAVDIWCRESVDIWQLV